MAQPKCKVPDCPRTAIPGRSPHGYCLEHEAELGKAKPRCPFPGCRDLPRAGRSPNDCCLEHEKFIRDLLFILPRIQWRQPETKGGLVLPGQPGFSVLQKNTG